MFHRFSGGHIPDMFSYMLLYMKGDEHLSVYKWNNKITLFLFRKINNSFTRI